MRKIGLFCLLITPLTACFTYQASSKLSDKEVLDRLKEIATSEVQIKDFHSKLGEKKVPIENEKAKALFKLEVLQRRILKSALKKDPTLYQKSVDKLMLNAPLVAVLDQKETGEPIEILIDNPARCNLTISFQAVLQEDQLQNHLCLNDFSYTGGFDYRYPVKVSMKKFDLSTEYGEEVVFLWSHLLDSELRKVANRLYLQERGVM
ncbi:hypothetical protein [Spartinivicinus ruber]|uniref:hypothetical protein n=1 Tax=Spartinivicinus ruber TaxID=2683272 RepID=UPI0013D89709|nr:hypothetical protein [Spartinivicinus ruber]